MSASPVATTTIVARRVPPPCWTEDETLALVNAYREKWLALRRGNLRAADWDAVSKTVSALGGGSKSPIQCRHKIEKLRKRYRAEKQRCLNRPGKFSSSWFLFPVLDAMGFASTSAVGPLEPEADRGAAGDGFGLRSKSTGSFVGGLDSDLGLDVECGMKLGRKVRRRDLQMVDGGFTRDAGFDHSLSGGCGLKRKRGGGMEDNDCHRSSFECDFGQNENDYSDFEVKGDRSRRRIETIGELCPVSCGLPMKDRNLVIPFFKSESLPKFARSFGSTFDYEDCINDRAEAIVGQRADFGTPFSSWSRKSGRGSGAVKGHSNPVKEVVSSVYMFTEMYTRMETSKIEIAKEIEKSRMEMETKQLQAMLKSYGQIVEALTEAVFNGEMAKEKDLKNDSPNQRL